ncbi:hypothetical protein J8J27_33780, partial [Mycobacterium tuberculosis]|nr:hypothetical protein [Mycobacterium tuberculosis]
MPSKGSGRSLGSLELAVREGDKLVAVGAVGTGFSVRVGDELKRRLDRLKVAKPLVDGPITRNRSIVWVKPELV